MRSGSAARGLGTGIAALALAAAACGDGPEEQGRDARALSGDGARAGPVTPARYVTDVTFVPFADGGRPLHLRFGNVTGPGRLERRYEGWALEGDAWRPLLSVRDSLPVPRAGWRVLPAEGLRVVASRDGGLGGLTVRDSAAPLRLELGRTLARWESPTGQSERFRRAAVDAGGQSRDGLALERRSAVTLDTPPPRGLHGFLLVADAEGRGMAILRHGGTPAGRRPSAVDTSAVAHAWTDEGERSWSEVRLEAVARGTPEAGEAVSPPAAWDVVIPPGGVRGRLTPGTPRELSAEPPGPGALPEGGDDGRRRAPRLYAVSGTLSVHGLERAVRGVGVEAGEP